MFQVWSNRQVRVIVFSRVSGILTRIISKALALCVMKTVKAAVLVLYPIKHLIKVSPTHRQIMHTTLNDPFLAAAAMHAMNGVVLGTKQLVVRLHEPKQLRQEKLAQRFGGNGHPRSASGATSPTVSEAGESFAGWSSPRHHTSTLGSPVATTADRGRRGSGSYYNVRPSWLILEVVVLMCCVTILVGCTQWNPQSTNALR